MFLWTFSISFYTFLVTSLELFLSLMKSVVPYPCDPRLLFFFLNLQQLLLSDQRGENPFTPFDSFRGRVMLRVLLLSLNCQRDVFKGDEGVGRGCWYWRHWSTLLAVVQNFSEFIWISTTPPNVWSLFGAASCPFNSLSPASLPNLSLPSSP